MSQECLASIAIFFEKLYHKGTSGQESQQLFSATVQFANVDIRATQWACETQMDHSVHLECSSQQVWDRSQLPDFLAQPVPWSC